MKKTLMLFVLLAQPMLVSATEMRDLIVKALVSDESVHDRVTGAVEKKFKSGTGSSEPVYATVKKITTYRNNCGRLEVTLTQDRVPTRDGKFEPIYVGYQFNMCPDGSQPKEPFDGPPPEKM